MKRSLLPALALALFAHTSFAAVNLNTAGKEELVTVSGVGPATAQAILDYRAQHGSFKSVDELKSIKGFGTKRFEKLKPEFTVGGAAPKGAAPAAGKAGAKPAVAVAGDIKPAK
jgi:competence protein ComEA